MKNMNSKKGFTLIELLIVIAIIAVLAVAFLPTLLGAPAKGRDTSRIASLEKIQKVLINTNLANKAFPATSGVVASALTYGTTTWGADSDIAGGFGGVFPVDPKSAWAYYYDAAPTVNTIKYNFGLYAMMETDKSANSTCQATFSANKIASIAIKTLGTKGTTFATDTTSATTDACYTILAQ